MGGATIFDFAKRLLAPLTKGAPVAAASPDAASATVIELAKGFFEQLKKLSPSWRAGYFNFQMEPGHYGCNGSYVDETGVELIGAIDHSAFFQSMEKVALRLFEELGKGRGALLLTCQSDYSYKIKYDWGDPKRWRITKLDGMSGIPDGEPDPR